MHIRDQSIPYMAYFVHFESFNSFLLKYLKQNLLNRNRKYFLQLFEKSEKNLVKMHCAFVIKSVISTYLTSTQSGVLMYLGIWKYHFIHSFFYESISLKKEHLKLMHLFLANQGQNFFFMICQMSLYILLPFYKAQAQ